jgi:hypothetical protein
MIGATSRQDASSSTIKTAWSRPIKEETNLKLLNLGSNIRDSMLWVFFSPYFVRNERQLYKTSHVLAFKCWKQT